MIALFAMLASIVLGAAGGKATHDFSHDYLLGTWNCTTTNSRGALGTGRASYKVQNGGSSIHEIASTLWAGAGQNNVDATIKYGGPQAGYTWIQTFSGRGWQTDHWWGKTHEIHLSMILGSGKTATLKQVSPTEYTLHGSDVTGFIVSTTCDRVKQ
jgi:hypothetical protein